MSFSHCCFLVRQHAVRVSRRAAPAGLYSSPLHTVLGPGREGRETGDLCPSVTHAALGLMLMENEMFKSLAEKYSSL